MLQRTEKLRFLAAEQHNRSATPESLLRADMRPFPSRVLLSAIALGAFTAGALYPKVIFFVLALGAVALLATSVLTSRWPFTRALQQFEGRPVVIHLWGALPPGLSGAPILTAVNALGAGAHAFFSAEGVASMHLKIAQPRDLRLGPGRVVIASARYVQWNGQKIPRMGGAQAVSIELIEPIAHFDQATARSTS